MSRIGRFSMATLLGSLLVYLGCAILYQGNSRRTSLVKYAFPVGNFQPRQIIALRLLAWSVMLLGLYFFSLPQGFERGVTVWIGVLGAAGFTNILLAAFDHSAQLRAAYAAAIASSAALLVWVL